jgi:hypothetical protein
MKKTKENAKNHHVSVNAMKDQIIGEEGLEVNTWK